MKTLATTLRNPSPRELGSECDDGQAIWEKSAGEAEANPGRVKETALRSAPCERGSRDMETRKPDALRSAKGRPEFSASTLGTTRETNAGVLRTDAELADVLEIECGWFIAHGPE